MFAIVVLSAVLSTPLAAQTADYEFVAHLVSYFHAPNICQPAREATAVHELELRLPAQRFACRGAIVELRDIRLSGLPARLSGTPKMTGEAVHTLKLASPITPQLSGSAMVSPPSGERPVVQAVLNAPLTGSPECGLRRVSSGSVSGATSIPVDYTCARSLLSAAGMAPGILTADTLLAVTLQWGLEQVSFTVVIQSTYRPVFSQTASPGTKPPATGDFRVDELNCSSNPARAELGELVLCTARVINPPNHAASGYEWFIDDVRISSATTHTLRYSGAPPGEHRVAVIATNGVLRTPAYTSMVVVKPPVVAAGNSQILKPNQARTLRLPNGQSRNLTTYCGSLAHPLATVASYSARSDVILLLYFLHCRKLPEGAMKAIVRSKLRAGSIRVAPVEQGLQFELTTPSATITTLGQAAYRVAYEPASGATHVAVEGGSAQVESQGEKRTLSEGDSARFGNASLTAPGCYAPVRTEVSEQRGQWQFDLPKGTATYGEGAESASYQWEVPAQFCTHDNELKGRVLVRGKFDAELNFRSVPPLLLQPQQGWSARAGALDKTSVRGAGLRGKAELVAAGSEWRFQILLSARKNEHKAVVTVWYAR